MGRQKSIPPIATLQTQFTKQPWPHKNPKPDKAKTTELHSDETGKTLSEKTPQHETNKTAMIVSVVGVVALIFIALR